MHERKAAQRKKGELRFQMGTRISQAMRSAVTEDFEDLLSDDEEHKGDKKGRKEKPIYIHVYIHMYR